MVTQLVRGIKDHQDPNMDVYADPPEMQAAKIPYPLYQNSSSTTARLDMVIIEQKDVTELTIPHNSLESMSRAMKC